MFEDICKKQDHYFPKEYLIAMLGTSCYDYSIYHKDYPWLEDMLEIAYDEFVSYYKKRFVIPESANKYEIGRIVRFFKVHNYNICIASGSNVTHIKRLVKNCGFDFRANLMISSKDAYASKSASDIFLACAIEMSVVPENFDEEKKK